VIQTELLRDAPRVVYVCDRAASRIRSSSPELQSDADNIVSLLRQKGSSYR
jgi:hypothetical protein